MGNEIVNVAPAVYQATKKTFTLTKKDSSGQTLTMTATIFDRNKMDNQTKNVDAPPGMIVDANDAIQFGGKRPCTVLAQAMLLQFNVHFLKVLTTIIMKQVQ